MFALGSVVRAEVIHTKQMLASRFSITFTEGLKLWAYSKETYYSVLDDAAHLG